MTPYTEHTSLQQMTQTTTPQADFCFRFSLSTFTHHETAKNAPGLLYDDNMRAKSYRVLARSLWRPVHGGSYGSPSSPSRKMTP